MTTVIDHLTLKDRREGGRKGGAKALLERQDIKGGDEGGHWSQPAWT